MSLLRTFLSWDGTSVSLLPVQSSTFPEAARIEPPAPRIALLRLVIELVPGNIRQGHKPFVGIPFAAKDDEAFPGQALK